MPLEPIGCRRSKQSDMSLAKDEHWDLAARDSRAEPGRPDCSMPRFASIHLKVMATGTISEFGQGRICCWLMKLGTGKESSRQS